MLAPIVQRRPFPTTAVGVLGGLLYVALLLFPRGSTESQAAPSVEGAQAANASTPALPQEGNPRPEQVAVEALQETAVESFPEILIEEEPARAATEAVETEVQKPQPVEPRPLESLRGQLTDELGFALAQWRVFLAHGGEEARSQTDDDGRFEFGEVERGEYTLLAWNPTDLRATRTSPLATTPSPLGFSPVTCSPPPIRKVLEGVVRTASGRPLIGVSVTPVLPVPQPGGGKELLRGEVTISLDEGRLSLRDIPRSSAPDSDDPQILFWVQGGGVFPALLPWTDGGLLAEEGAELTIEFAEDGKSLRQATHLVVHDAAGHPRKIVRRGVLHWSATWGLPLEGLAGSRLRVVVPLDVVEVKLVRRRPGHDETRVTGRSGLQLSDLRETRVRLR